MYKAVKVLSIILLSVIVGMFIAPNLELPEANAQQSAEKDERIYMLNVLWFKEDGGAEKYQEYMAAAGPFAAKHGATYPMLVAGLADKQKASAAFPALDRIRSYPTAIFLDAQGKVRAVHSGFSGPATGAAYDELRAEYERLIEELLAEAERER